MSYTWAQVSDAAKREARAGVVGDYTEQYSTDLIEYINRVIFKIWAVDNWDFGKTAISLTVAAGETSEKTLAATIGEIIIMGISGQSGYLKSFTEKQFRQWQKRADQTGTIYGYIKRGLDSNGAIKVLFIDSPVSATVIDGQGKTKLSKVTLADLAASTVVPYFPDDMTVLIIEWVAGIFMSAIGDPRGPSYIVSAERAVASRAGSSSSDASDDDTTPPPDMIKFNARKRGGTTVA